MQYNVKRTPKHRKTHQITSQSAMRNDEKYPPYFIDELPILHSTRKVF